MSDQRCVWHLDATGSLVPKWKGKHVFCYALVTATPIKGEPSLPLLEWLSNAHDVKTIRKALVNWWIDVQCLLKKPAAVIVDKSWALLHAIALALNNLTLEQQLHEQWKIIAGLIKTNEETISVIRLCVNHYIKSVIRSLSKKAIPPLVL